MTLFLNEAQRFTALWRSYRWSTISSIVIHAIIFPVLMLLFDSLATRYGSDYGTDRQLQSLIGFLVWYLCMKLMVAILTMVEEESVVGTLENIILTNVSFEKTLVLRTVVMTLRLGLETALLATVLSLALGLTLTFTPATILITLLLLLGSCGVGFALAGLALLYKSVSSVSSVIGNLALLLSGALVPLDGLGPIFTVMKYGFPMTWGISLLRQMTFLPGFVNIAELAGLTLHTLFMLGIGWLVFSTCLQRARRQGALSSH
ncbi:MAG: ABC transporter permease [Candidatus Promineifilaceae bacterium]